MFVNVNRVGNSITGSVNGKPYGVRYSEERYKAMKELAEKTNSVSTVAELNDLIEAFSFMTVESYKDVVETKSEYLFVNESRGTYHLKVGKSGRISSEPIPQALVDRIIKSVEQGIDVLPLVKCWARFLRNPNYSRNKAKLFANYINKTYINRDYARELVAKEKVTEEIALERATTFQTPITQEGLLCTYKVSAELNEKFVLDADGKAKKVPLKEAEIDPITGIITYKDPEFVEDRIFYPAVQGLYGGDAFFCGDKLGHVIRVGYAHRLESWSQVNCDDSSSCVKGLHCGNLDYIRGYQKSGTVTHYTFVDPMHIGAFTDDGSGAIRVLEYYTYASFVGVTKSIYHSSSYAKQTDEAYAELFAEAAKISQEKAEAVSDRLYELDAIREL